MNRRIIGFFIVVLVVVVLVVILSGLMSIGLISFGSPLQEGMPLFNDALHIQGIDSSQEIFAIKAMFLITMVLIIALCTDLYARGYKNFGYVYAFKIRPDEKQYPKYIFTVSIVFFIGVALTIAFLGSIFSVMVENIYLTAAIFVFFLLISSVNIIMTSFSINHAEEPIKSIIEGPFNKNSNILEEQLKQLKSATDNINGYMNTANKIFSNSAFFGEKPEDVNLLFDVQSTGSKSIIRIGTTLEGFSDHLINVLAEFVEKNDDFSEMRILISRDSNPNIKGQQLVKMKTSTTIENIVTRFKENRNIDFKICIRYMEINFHSVMFSLGEFKSFILIPQYNEYDEYDKKNWDYNWGILIEDDRDKPTKKKIIQKNNKIFDELWTHLSIITHEDNYLFEKGEFLEESLEVEMKFGIYEDDNPNTFISDNLNSMYCTAIKKDEQIHFIIKREKDE